jgi:uncharacterized membrane protein YhaH (DUF805 family)
MWLDTFALFKFRGRLPRLGFFRDAVWLGFIVGVFAVLGTQSLIQGGAGSIFGPIWLAVGALLIWGGIALTIRRLHDIGLSGVHVIWIWLVNVAATSFIAVSPVLSLLSSFLALGVALWLLFAPSDPALNKYDYSAA